MGDTTELQVVPLESAQSIVDVITQVCRITDMVDTVAGGWDSTSEWMRGDLGELSDWLAISDRAYKNIRVLAMELRYMADPIGITVVLVNHGERKIPGAVDERLASLVGVPVALVVADWSHHS